MIGSSETIEPHDVGLDADAPLPFEFRAGAHPSPLIVSFPHVGLDWPASLGPRPQVNFPRNADYAVDRLYLRAEALGAATLRARYSRLVVDLNRADDDVSAELVPDHPAPRPRESASVPTVAGRRAIRNRGVVWSTAVGNIPLFSTLSHAALVDRLDRFYWPYHRALETLIERRRQHYGYAILLDAHSMPGSVGGDLVLGTRLGQACGRELIDEATAVLSGERVASSGRWPLSLMIDDPYRGGHVIGRHGRPARHVHALQLEISRALYMDELRLDALPLPDAAELEAWMANPRRGSWSSWPRQAQTQRDRRSLLALLSALDGLVSTLSREREHLAEPSAAE